MPRKSVAETITPKVVSGLKDSRFAGLLDLTLHGRYVEELGALGGAVKPTEQKPEKGKQVQSDDAEASLSLR